MKKIIHIFIILMIFNYSCKDYDKETHIEYNLNEKVKKRLAKTIDSMYTLDQSNRKLYYKLDASYGINKDSIFNEGIDLRTALGDKYKDYFNDYVKTIKFVKKSDSLNTEKLIKITKKYGFPNNKRLGEYKSKAYLIFVHSPKYFFEEIDTLIDFEYKHNRISEYKLTYIKWHISDRKGLPPVADKNGNLVTY